MTFLSQQKGFLGYDATQDIEAKVIVVPFGLEKTVSYGGGTKNGPREIIKASHQVELFDEELNKEHYKEIGIKTIKPFAIKKDINELGFENAAIKHSISNTSSSGGYIGWINENQINVLNKIIQSSKTFFAMFYHCF